MIQTETHRDELVLSYHRVRQALGFLGFFLPLLLIIGGLFCNGRIEPSISDFFHTALRDVFVGTLCAIGIFLISYKGYRRVDGELMSDDWVATLAGLGAFGIAFFPNGSPTHEPATLSQEAFGLTVAPFFHYGGALIFFTCLAIFCYVKFPRTAKPARRRIYRWCGHVIVVATVLTIITSYIKVTDSGGLRPVVLDYNLVFWFEALGVWAFAFSWLTKGKADLTLGLRRRAAEPASEAHPAE